MPEKFLVLLSDERTDLPAQSTKRTPRVWGYEVEAENYPPALDLGLELWRAEVGDDREALSITVVRQRT